MSTPTQRRKVVVCDMNFFIKEGEGMNVVDKIRDREMREREIYIEREREI